MHTSFQERTNECVSVLSDAEFSFDEFSFSIALHANNSDTPSQFAGEVSLDGALTGALTGALNESILRLVNEQPGIQRHALVDALDVPSRTVDRYIKELAKAGIIDRRGSKKTGGY